MFSKLPFHILLYVKWPRRRCPSSTKNTPLDSWYPGKKRKLVKFPIIHLTTDSLNTKKFVILQQVEAVTVVSTSSMGKNAELKEINVNRDRSQVSSICKKSQGKDSITCAPLCRFYIVHLQDCWNRCCWLPKSFCAWCKTWAEWSIIPTVSAAAAGSQPPQWPVFAAGFNSHCN